MKDEIGGKVMREVIALIPKMYAGPTNESKERKEVCDRMVKKIPRLQRVY